MPLLAINLATTGSDWNCFEAAVKNYKLEKFTVGNCRSLAHYREFVFLLHINSRHQFLTAAQWYNGFDTRLEPSWLGYEPQLYSIFS